MTDKEKFGFLVRDVAKSCGVTLVPEHKFHPTRRWKFDYAIPDLKIGIEYEGLVSRKSRHTTLKGYSGDCEKYNEAALHGWKVLRYTVINYGQSEDHLIRLIESLT